MGRIEETFGRLKARGERALVVFVTAGDPSLEQLPDILQAVTEGGADIIEVGLPFSDPIADGPTIQAASQRALESGTTVNKVFEIMKGFEGPPIVFMGYLNPILRMGTDAFARRAAAAGGAGTIVCDTTPEEALQWVDVSRAHGLDTIFLTAPNSTDERLRTACEASSGFVYAVSRTGVTGAANQPWSEAEVLVSRVRKVSDLSVCVGFGISNPGDVKQVCNFADGAIVGSAIIQSIADSWTTGNGAKLLTTFVRELKEATRF